MAVTRPCGRGEAREVATDASEEALTIAQSNAARFAARVSFTSGAWYEPVAGLGFDLIVSNPPYVAAEDPHLSRGDLRFEPRRALTDGSPDGLGAIRDIVGGAPGHLKSGGWLLIEHGYDQAEMCRALLEDTGFVAPVSLPDLAGIARVAGGRLP